MERLDNYSSSSHICISAIDECRLVNNLIITGAIRSGKTEKAIKKVKEFVKANKKAIYICRSHEQCKDVARRLDKKGVKVLHLTGGKYKNIDYALNKGITPKQFYELLKENRKFRNRYKASDISTKITELAEEMLVLDDIDVVVTVPEMAIKLDPKDVLVLDELTTVGWFLPKPVLIREFVNKPNQGYESKKCQIKRLMAFLKQNSDDYEWLSELVRELDKFIEIYGEKKKTKDKPLISAAHKIEILITMVLAEIRENNGLRLKLEGIIKETNEEKRETFEVLWAVLSDTRPKAQTFPGSVKIYLIPNEKEILFEEWIREFESLIVVVDSEKRKRAEEFPEKLDRRFIINEAEPFKYKYNFVLAETDNIFTVGKLLYDYKIPTMWVVGRKKDIEPFKKLLKEYGLTNVDDATIKTREDLKKKAERGEHIIVYLNSRISKGIDLPEYNAVIVYNYNFAVPDGDFKEEVAWELWQTILRVTPCGWQDDYEKLRPKLVIFPKGKILPCSYIDLPVLRKSSRFFKNLDYFFWILSNSTSFNQFIKQRTALQGEKSSNFLYNKRNVTEIKGKKSLIVVFAVLWKLFNEIEKKDILVKEFPLVAEILLKLGIKTHRRKQVEKIFFRFTRDKALIYEFLSILDEKRILEGYYGRYYKFKPFKVKLEQINKYGYLNGVICGELPLIAI